MKKENLASLLIIESLILIMIFINYQIKIVNTNRYNTELNQENTNLQIELVEKSNEIFQTELDLRMTEQTLANTAEQLKEMERSDSLLNFEYLGEYNCTAYCCEKYPHICGTGSGMTSSGQPIQPDVSVAVGDTKKLPYGTVIYIEGVGIRIVQDTGKLGKHQIDVAVDTHDNALSWNGQGKHKVWILKEGDCE